MLRLAALGIPLLPLAAAYEWYDVNNQPTQPWQKGQVGVSLFSLSLFSKERLDRILRFSSPISLTPLKDNDSSSVVVSTTLVARMIRKTQCLSTFFFTFSGSSGCDSILPTRFHSQVPDCHDQHCRGELSRFSLVRNSSFR